MLPRLEHRPGGLHGPCPRCGGMGKLTLVNEADGETIETARGCTGCGKVGKVTLLRLAEDPGRGQGAFEPASAAGAATVARVPGVRVGPPPAVQSPAVKGVRDRR